MPFPSSECAGLIAAQTAVKDNPSARAVRIAWLIERSARDFLRAGDLANAWRWAAKLRDALAAIVAENVCGPAVTRALAKRGLALARDLHAMRLGEAATSGGRP
ncbi:MAG TPA: hypothetical protein VEF36_15345 [Roseiarcus sp.]|nr:hypothetical protein [Roseiarcus sp.]